MNDDFEEKLRLLTAAREKLQADLAETATVLDAVENKIQDFKRRQEARMFEDVRLDNDLLKQQQDKATDRAQAIDRAEKQKVDAPARNADNGSNLSDTRQEA
jgi:hypothetical protein